MALGAGYAVRGVAGFGSGVVATPLLTFVLPLSITAPLITVIGFFVSIRQALVDWPLIEWRRVAVFIPGSLIGTALGLYVFKAVDPLMLARVLGAYILLYSFYSMFGERWLRRPLQVPRWLVHPVAFAPFHAMELHPCRCVPKTPSLDTRGDNGASRIPAQSPVASASRAR